MSEELQQTIKELVVPGKGILAADESVKTATKRLASINTESTEETRRQYRNLILTAPGIGDYITGVILFEETLDQAADDGTSFPEFLKQHGVVPGIKVDGGLADAEGTDGEQITQGLDVLRDRLKQYKPKGARFTKWRSVYHIGENKPTQPIIDQNAKDLAAYAKIAQEEGYVPIVEPEVLIDGTHSIDQCEDVTTKVLTAVFAQLQEQGVELPHIVLKPSMVISGKSAENRADVEEVARRTIKVLKATVPEQVPSINFLSGGQSAEEATAHLNAMHKQNPELPWYVSFSYARALQGPALEAWQGKQDKVQAGQDAFIKRAQLNGLATQGQYTNDME